MSSRGRGRAFYLKQLAPEVIAKRLADDDFRFLVAENGDALVGVAAMQGQLAPVSPVRGQGLPARRRSLRQLWKILREEALSAGPPRSFKANVPRYAIGAYTRLGFTPDGEFRDEKGVRFQPMTCPAKRLAAGATT